MEEKIKVYGKAQNRTALGIVHAYLVMHPETTLNEFRQAFPNDLCPDSGVKELLLPVEEAEKFNTKMSLYFAKPDEVLTLSDGQQIALAQVWSKSSFEKIVANAKTYDIVIAEFEKTMKGEKGGYRLEYLNGYVPPTDTPEKKKKKSLWWLWVLIILLLLGALAYMFLKPASQPQVVERVVEVEKQVVVRDTVYVEQIAEIETAFNAAQFEQGKADLNEKAKFALHDLAKVLSQNPELRLSITGHTSSEGDADVNLKLSKERAQAAVDFLVNTEGIDASRLTAAGKGSSEPVDPNNPEANRRTEFEIIK